MLLVHEKSVTVTDLSKKLHSARISTSVILPWQTFIAHTHGRGPDRPGVVRAALVVAAARIPLEAALGVVTTIVGAIADRVRP